MIPWEPYSDPVGAILHTIMASRENTKVAGVAERWPDKGTRVSIRSTPEEMAPFLQCTHQRGAETRVPTHISEHRLASTSNISEARRRAYLPSAELQPNRISTTRTLALAPPPQHPHLALAPPPQLPHLALAPSL